MRRLTSLAIFLIVPAAIAVYSLSVHAKGNTEIVFDETIYRELEKSKQFRTAHHIMVQQSQRLNQLQSSFLLGDAESVDLIAGDLAKDMNSVIGAVKLDEGQDAAAMRFMAEIVTDAREVQKSIRQNKSYEAYIRYQQILGRCINCHQATRSWGKFATPEDQAATEKASSTSY